MIPPHAARQNGYVVGTGTPRKTVATSTTLDVFFGPFCEDSRRLFATIKKLAWKKSKVLLVRAHLFPLPYNAGSFLAAQTCVSAGIVTANRSMVPTCLEVLYSDDNQKRIKTAALTNATTPQIISQLIDLISVNLQVDRSQLKAQMEQGLESGQRSYTVTKSDWKFGASKGVFATPAVFLNDVQIFGYDPKGAKHGEDHAEGQLSAMTTAEWERFLSPVLQQSNV